MKTRKIISIATLVLALILSLAACGDQEDAPQDTGPVNLVVVGSNRANMNALPLNHTKVQKYIYDACYHWGTVAFVTSDGSPEVAYGCQVEQPGNLSEAKHKSLAENYTSQLQNIAGQIIAQEAEADTLEALRVASFELTSRPGERTMLILDNALSTCGYLDFAENPTLLDTNPEVVLDALTRAEALPDLSGTNIYFVGIGETAHPQPKLSEKQKKALEEIWHTVCMASGANQVTFLNGISSGIANDCNQLPTVSIVQTEARTLDGLIPTQVLTSDQVAFLGDQAVFRDPQAAHSAIASVAEALASNDNKVIVLGSTAGGDRGTSLLARNRAEAVADILTEMGIDPSRLQVIGLAGADNPFYVVDIDPDTGLQTESASLNRCVRIIDSNSPEAALVLQ